jgi:hypothetical protein
MKKIVLLFVFISFFSIISNAQYHERDWKWHPYASLTKGGNTFMVVYYGYNIMGYDGKVRWKLENKAAKPVFGADLAEQSYTLKNGEIIKKKGLDFKTRRIEPGETAMTLAITVESGEKSGIEKVEVISPEVVLNFGKNMIYEWNKLGTIEIAP